MHRAEIDFPRVSPQGMQRILIGVGGVHIQERRDFTLDISTVDCLRSRDLDLSTADITFWYPIWRKGNARNIRGWCTNRHATLCGIGSANVPKMANGMRRNFSVAKPWRSRFTSFQDLRRFYQKVLSTAIYAHRHSRVSIYNKLKPKSLIKIEAVLFVRGCII